MASPALTIYETTLAQAIYQTLPGQVVTVRPDGLHWLDLHDIECEAFRQEWRQLATRVADPNPFYEEWYLRPSLRAFDQGGQVRIAALICDGSLRALMPFHQASAYYGYPVPHTAAWRHANIFNAVPLIERAYGTQFWAAVLGAFDRDPGGSLFLHLPAMPQGSEAEQALQQVVGKDGRPAGIVAREDRAFLQSEIGADDYYETSLTRKRRKELARLRKRLGEEGALTFHRHHGADRLAEWIDEFVALEASGWKGREQSAIGSAPETHALFRDALSGAAQQGRLERIDLRVDGRPVAMLVNFLCAPGAFSFKTAFDENYARYSPGFLLQRENLQLLDRDDIDWCDSCASEGHPMIERIWRQKRTMLGRNVAIGGGIRRRIFERLLRAEMKKDTPA